ncbi:MAG: hypothetical protein IBX61_09400 [Thermoleophilia bacterium]|nr:hypothetical protein [Thermoleophilia bacterium]
MSSPVAVARLLNSLGIVTYDEAGASGDCFTGPLPPEPDLAVSIRQYGGSGDIKFAQDMPRIQVRVRAATSGEALAKATEIYNALHALSYTVLNPGGDAEAYLIECRALDLPGDIGADENGRPEFSTNYEITQIGNSTYREA